MTMYKLRSKSIHFTTHELYRFKSLCDIKLCVISYFYIFSQSFFINIGSNHFFLLIEASRDARTQVCPNVIYAAGCEFNSHSRKWNMYLNLHCISSLWCRGESVALSSATQHAKPQLCLWHPTLASTSVVAKFKAGQNTNFGPKYKLVKKRKNV